MTAYWTQTFFLLLFYYFYFKNKNYKYMVKEVKQKKDNFDEGNAISTGVGHPSANALRSRSIPSSKSLQIIPRWVPRVRLVPWWQSFEITWSSSGVEECSPLWNEFNTCLMNVSGRWCLRFEELVRRKDCHNSFTSRASPNFEVLSDVTNSGKDWP